MIYIHTYKLTAESMPPRAGAEAGVAGARLTAPLLARAGRLPAACLAAACLWGTAAGGGGNDDAGARLPEPARLEAVRLEPDVARGHYESAQSFYEAALDGTAGALGFAAAEDALDRALADYSEAIRLAPDEWLYRAQRGRFYFETGDYGKAAEDLTDAILADTGVSSDPYYAGYRHIFRGAAYHAAGDYDLAAADFETVHSLRADRFPRAALNFIREDARSARAPGRGRSPEASRHFVKGLVNFYLPGRVDEAITEFESAKKFDPTAFAYDHMIALACLQAGDSAGHYERGLTHINNVIKRAPATIASAEYYKLRADLYAASHKHPDNREEGAAKGAADLGKAIQLAPNAAEYHTARAQRYLILGNIRKARADHIKAIRLMKDDEFYNYLAEKPDALGKAGTAGKASKTGSISTDVSDNTDNANVVNTQGNADMQGGADNDPAASVKFSPPPVWAWITTDVLFLTAVAALIIFVRRRHRKKN